MSKPKKFILDKKDDIDIEKLETRTNIDKSGASAILSKSKNSKKEELFNKSLQEKPIPEQEIKSNLSYTGKSVKIQKENPLKKYNSDKMSGFFTFSNKKEPFIIGSEQERFDKKKIKKNIPINNNNIIKRVREFVPCKEYLNLLEEIDDEEDLNIETKNSLNISISKINKDNNNNNNSEDHHLNNIEDKKKEEIPRIIEEIEEKNNILETQNDEIYNIFNNENNKNEENKINNKIFDIYNIDVNLEFNDKKEQMEKFIDFCNYDHSYTHKEDLSRFREYMKEERDKKFKKEYYNNFSIYTTNILFKYGDYSSNVDNYEECILLLRKPFLYVLNPNSSPITEESIKFFNPDISIINNIEINNNKKININNYILKNKYNLSSPLLSLNFNLLSCKLLVNKRNFEFQIIILGTKDKFSFVSNNKELFNKFIYLIQNMISNTQGSKHNILGLSLRNNIFYKETYISTYEFESQAKTGDLLLFRTIDTCANCQRFFTCDEYDHVGIIIKRNKKLFIFESTSIGKCTTLSWNCFKTLLFNLVYYRIAYRKLNYENENLKNNSEHQRLLDEKCALFLKDIEGKDYYLSIPRILCCKKPDKYEYEKDWKKAKGLCCSALAAAMYIKFGIVKLEKSVHSTKPGDFEQDRNRLTFEEGYSLGPEKIIEFSE